MCLFFQFIQFKIVLICTICLTTRKICTICLTTLRDCWGFVDGTAIKVSRPIYNQRIMYSGHKRIHCLKFQVKQIFIFILNTTGIHVSSISSIISKIKSYIVLFLCFCIAVHCCFFIYPLVLI